MELKQCKNGATCVQAEKYPDGVMPVGEFHPEHSRCKKCWSLFVQDAPNREVDIRKSLAREDGENSQRAVIHECGKLGIFAERHGLVDARAWGCVHLEIKSSTPVSQGVWRFSFNNRSGVNGRLVVLVPLNSDGIPLRYCVFPANFPAFFRNGKIKRGVQVMSNPLHRKSGYNPLTMLDMDNHENAWHLIEQVRRHVSDELKHGINSNKRTNRPAEKPLPMFDKRAG